MCENVSSSYIEARVEIIMFFNNLISVTGCLLRSFPTTSSSERLCSSRCTIPPHPPGGAPFPPHTILRAPRTTSSLRVNTTLTPATRRCQTSTTPSSRPRILSQAHSSIHPWAPPPRAQGLSRPLSPTSSCSTLSTTSDWPPTQPASISTSWSLTNLTKKYYKSLLFSFLINS